MICNICRKNITPDEVGYGNENDVNLCFNCTAEYVDKIPDYTGSTKKGMYKTKEILLDDARSLLNENIVKAAENFPQSVPKDKDINRLLKGNISTINEMGKLLDETTFTASNTFPQAVPEEKDINRRLKFAKEKKKKKWNDDLMPMNW